MINRDQKHVMCAVALLAFCAVGSTNVCFAAEHTAKLQFNRDIRPILSDKCFHCHGPDTNTREAELRLDVEESARSVITAGQPSSSKLVARITHKNADERMPPADSGRVLSAKEIGQLTRWVEEGAEWQEHWAFIPPTRPLPPKVKRDFWPHNPIDAFVLARLEREGLQPAEPADKVTLIRRVNFDLTGLPPTPEQIDAYLADESPRAFERVVDRLLDSSEYAERMAMQWLDVARYADSHGYSLDRRRVMWPWRDWVIRAYHENMPFDRFVTEQLAGDLIPNATVSQQIATGFNRNHPIQSEGGVINEEYRVETVVDRVETTSSAFLGLTMGCCRCHDHKYDPISQKEFYSLYAFFNSVPESAHVGNGDRLADKPVVTAPSVLRDMQQTQLQQRIDHWQNQLEADSQSQIAAKAVEQIIVDDEVPTGAEAFGNGGGSQKFEFVSGPDHPVFHGQRSSRRSCTGRGQHGFQNLQPGLAITAETSLFAWVYIDPTDPPKQIMLQWNNGSWEHRAFWGGDHIPWGQSNTGSRRFMGPIPKPGKWTRLDIEASKVGLGPGTNLQGIAFTQFDGTVYWDNAGLVDKPQLPASRQLATLKAELAALESTNPTTMVMGDMNPPRKTFVLQRGQYDQPSEEEVTPAVPAAIGSLPATDDTHPVNRMTLARWLVAPENPLTARVAVNRYWQMYFGMGIVKTPEDFGSQGVLPHHPELLDWLATEFIRSKWNVKALQKLIVMSATYQQSSHTPATEGQETVDPDNHLLARGPRYRLPAEMIRDNALAVSGLLVRRLGGPGVRPYQPKGLWDDVVYENVPRFQQDHGDKLYRRSMYTYWKRSVPPPNLQVFDAPSREACVLQRSRTNTPLGALVLMNDPTFVEASRKLAEKVMKHEGDPDKRLARMFRLVTGRFPAETDATKLRTALVQLLGDYRGDRDAAERLMRIGEAPADASLETTEVAAFAAIANVLLGLDETITKN